MAYKTEISAYVVTTHKSFKVVSSNQIAICASFAALIVANSLTFFSSQFCPSLAINCAHKFCCSNVAPFVCHKSSLIIVHQSRLSSNVNSHACSAVIVESWLGLSLSHCLLCTPSATLCPPLCWLLLYCYRCWVGQVSRNCRISLAN